MASKIRRKRGNQLKSSGRIYSKEDSKIDFQVGNNDDDDSSDNNGEYRTRKRKRRNQMQDENVSSDEEDEEQYESDSEDDDDDEKEVEETVEAKKLRLAKEYLSKVSSKTGEDDSSGSSSDEDGENDDDDDDEEGDNDEHANIARKLKRERMKREGTLHRVIASKMQKSIIQMYTSIGILSQEEEEEQQQQIDTQSFTEKLSTYESIIPHTFTREQTNQFQSSPYMKQLRGHDLTPTCVSLHTSGSVAYSGSKDNSVLSWDVEYAKKLHCIVPDWKKTDMEYSKKSGEVLALANSDDGRYLAVGGRDALVRIFDVRLMGKKSQEKVSSSLITSFKGHKGAVTSLAFRTRSLQLFSGSEDRCIRHYNLDQMAYTETLYGHQGPITSLTCHQLPRPLSTGRDRTLRAWKISDETHLIFRGGSKATSADCITPIKDDWYLTGHEDGCVNLWYTEKKKPVSVLEWDQYGRDGLNRGSGIVCADALRGSDLAMTGSKDGVIRLWRVQTGKASDDRGIFPLARIPVHGFVNGIAIGPKGRFCVAAIGQEHRLGRWERVAKAKNRFAIISLREGNDEEDDIDAGEVDDTIENGKGTNINEDDEMEADVESANEGGESDEDDMESSPEEEGGTEESDDDSDDDDESN